MGNLKARLFGIVVTVVVALFTLAGPGSAADPHWPETLTIATASPGGTYHVYGARLAKILTRVLGLPVGERATDGPRQNIQMIEAGEAQLAFVTLGAALEAWTGSAAWTDGKQYRSVRALFPMYDTPFHFVALKNSHIHSLSDNAVRRIGVGPKDGTAGTYAPVFLKTLKIDAALIHGSWDELARELSEGGIDVLAVAAGAPLPAVADLEAKKKVVLLAPSPEQIRALRLAMPELTPSTIPAGTYPSLKKGYATVGLYNFAVAGKGLPDDLVYAIVDAVFANQHELVDAHPAAAATVPANFVHNTVLPYHPGAFRYYANRVMTDAPRGD